MFTSLSNRLLRPITTAVVAAAGLIALSAVAFGDDDAEHVAAIAERLDDARARMETASYRVVLNQEFMKEWRDQVGVDVTNNQLTMDAVEKGALRRVATDRVVRYEDDRPDQETTRKAVRNGDGIAIRRGDPPVPVLIYEHESIETAAEDVRRRFDVVGGADYTLFGFGQGYFRLSDALEQQPDPERWRVREVAGGLIQIRYYSDSERETLGVVTMFDPERDLVTRVTQYHPNDGEVTTHHEVEPMAVEDHHGELIWFPEMVQQEVWRRDDEGNRYLGSHRIYRFENVELNHPVSDEELSFVDGLDLGEEDRVHHFRLDGQVELLRHEDGELVSTGRFAGTENRAPRN